MKALKSIQKVFIFSTFLSSLIFANTIYFPDDYPTLTLAVNNAANGDTIIVRDGIYHEVFRSSNHIVIQSENGPENCIFLSGEFITGSESILISGFKFENSADIVVGGSAKIQNCIFTNIDNTCPNFIRLWTDGYGQQVDIIDCQFSDNITENLGLILVQTKSDAFVNVNIDKCVFINNTYTGSGSGGAICVSTGNVNSNINISNSYFISNKILIGDSPAGEGGAVSCTAPDIFIGNCYFYDNIANEGSAVCIGNGTNSIIYNSTFVDNSNIAISNSSSNKYSSSSVNKSNFLNNKNGIQNSCREVFFDADSCWWGSSSGPYHPAYNMNGLGDSVNLYVDIIPFLTEPDINAPLIPVQNLNVDTIGIDFIEISWDPSPIGDLSGYKICYKTDTTELFYTDTIDVGNVTSYLMTGLSEGTNYYITAICYDTDGNHSWYSPIIVTSPKPVSVIYADSAVCKFDNTLIGDTTLSALKIFNKGTAPLIISDVISDNPQFIPDMLDFTIPPNDSAELSIQFIPQCFGIIFGNLIIYSDAINNDVLVIPMQGFGDLPPEPEILSIKDVPDDQGGEVRLKFSRSKYDGLDSTYKIVSYTAWRLIEKAMFY